MLAYLEGKKKRTWFNVPFPDNAAKNGENLTVFSTSFPSFYVKRKNFGMIFRLLCIQMVIIQFSFMEIVW